MRKLCDKELAPYAQEIDKNNGFSKMRVCTRDTHVDTYTCIRIQKYMLVWDV